MRLNSDDLKHATKCMDQTIDIISQVVRAIVQERHPSDSEEMQMGVAIMLIPPADFENLHAIACTVNVQDVRAAAALIGFAAQIKTAHEFVDDLKAKAGAK